MTTYTSSRSRRIARGSKRTSAPNVPVNPTPAAPPPSPSTVIKNMKAPEGGWRTNLTTHDKKIIAAIKERPGYTAKQYWVLAKVDRAQVNDTLLYTRQGRALAEQGMVNTFILGSKPRWYKLLNNKGGVKKVMDADSMLETAVLDDVPEEMRDQFAAQSQAINDLAFNTTTSARKLIERAAQANAAISSNAVTQAQLADEMRILKEEMERAMAQRMQELETFKQQLIELFPRAA